MIYKKENMKHYLLFEIMPSKNFIVIDFIHFLMAI